MGGNIPETVLCRDDYVFLKMPSKKLLVVDKENEGIMISTIHCFKKFHFKYFSAFFS